MTLAANFGGPVSGGIGVTPKLERRRWRCVSRLSVGIEADRRHLDAARAASVADQTSYRRDPATGGPWQWPRVPRNPVATKPRCERSRTVWPGQTGLGAPTLLRWPTFARWAPWPGAARPACRCVSLGRSSCRPAREWVPRRAPFARTGVDTVDHTGVPQPANRLQRNRIEEGPPPVGGVVRALDAGFAPGPQAGRGQGG